MTNALLSPAILRSPELLQRLTEISEYGEESNVKEILSSALEYLAGIQEGVTAVTSPLARLIGYEGSPDNDARDPYAGEVIVALVRRAIKRGYTVVWDSEREVTLEKGNTAIMLYESPKGSIVNATVVVNGVLYDLDHVALNLTEGPYNVEEAVDEAWFVITEALRNIC